MVRKVWKYGFVQVGEVNFESAAYVARYCLKKVNGAMADEHYMNVDMDGVAQFVSPEYTTMSRRPGIGRDWYKKYKDDCYPRDEVPVANSGVFKKLPRYYDELFKAESPEIYEEIQATRKAFKEAHADDYTPQRLMDKYKVAKRKKEMLIRGL